MLEWKYTAVEDAEGGASANTTPKAPRLQNIRACLNSRLFGRILLVVAIILLGGNLFFPAREELRRHGYFLQQEKANEHIMVEVPSHSDDVDWSDYAYCQYVTDEDYLCNSVMIFESLDRLGAKADRLMMYPSQWSPEDGSQTGRLLTKARDEYRVRLEPIEVQHFDGEITWADSFTKLLAFNQTKYKRVLSLDSDATILQHMDELFLIPSAPVAMPRAYWLEDTLSSQLVLIEPSEYEFQRIQDAFASRGSSDFDMEIVNNLYSHDCFVIPHRRYDLLSGEFRSKRHDRYLGNSDEVWDPDAILKEAKFLHFSDWPHPKPWIYASKGTVQANQPQCVGKAATANGTCRDREVWLSLYADFRERRKTVCDASTSLVRREEMDMISVRSKYEPVFE